MAWVPFVVASRRSRYHRNRAGGAIVAVLIFFLVLGLLFFVFFNRSNGFTIIPLWTIIIGLGGLIIAVTVIGIIAASMSAPSKKANEEHIKSYQYQHQRQSQQSNPYMIRDSMQKQPEEPIYKEITREIPVVADINYCRYCGAKVDRDAIFCHQCGTKL